MSVAEENVERYERAKQLADKIRKEWEAIGSPLTTEGGATGRAIVSHPLVKMMQEAERDADRFARAIAKRAPGPDPAAKVSSSVGKSPAAQLRAVG